MATTTTQPRVSDEDMGKLLTLIKGADSVELKLTVPESDLRSTVAALGMDPLDAQIRQVFFFDTPDLQLNARGVVVRARRVQQKGDDSVVKLRPVVPSELPGKLRKSPNFGVEVDATPGAFVCSGSLKASLGTKAVRAGSSARRRSRPGRRQGARVGECRTRGGKSRRARDDSATRRPAAGGATRLTPLEFG